MKQLLKVIFHFYKLVEIIFCENFLNDIYEKYIMNKDDKITLVLS